MGKDMTAEQMKNDLQEFLAKLKEYLQLRSSRLEPSKVETLRSELRRAEPNITHIILTVVGNGAITQMGQIVRYSDILLSVLLSGWYSDVAIALIERAIGTLEAGLWSPKPPPPVLTIHDVELQQRCSDLLRAPGNFDRVVRETTTILETRIRQKPPHEVLSGLITNSGDQIGENLVNKLFDHNAPVLSVSEDKDKRLAFKKMLIGVMSYLRNESHHTVSAETEWSWAWSTVGLVDRLLAEINSCVVRNPTS